MAEEFREALFIVAGTSAPVIALAHVVAVGQSLDAVGELASLRRQPAYKIVTKPLINPLASFLVGYFLAASGWAACLFCLKGSLESLALANNSGGVEAVQQELLLAFLFLFGQVAAFTEGTSSRRQLAARIDALSGKPLRRPMPTREEKS